MIRALTIVVMLSACTSFEELDRGVCGNGLIEAGEDCDSSADSCVRCAVVCGAAADCPTADYTCGVDGLCHAPGGGLAKPVAAGTFQVNDLQITDVDHDAIGDVVGSSRTSIVVRHGAPTGALIEVDSLVTPSQTGPAAFGDIDGDGSLDVTIVTPDGLVSYTSPYDTLSPLAVQSVQFDQAGGVFGFRKLFRVNDLVLGAFVADPQQDKLYLAVVDLLFPDRAVFVEPCGVRNGSTSAAAFKPATVDVYQVNQDGTLGADIVVAMRSGTAGKLCVMSIHKDFLVDAEVADVTPLNAVTPTAPLVLADLDADGDACPGLVNASGGAAALRYWDGAMSLGRCTARVNTTATGAALPTIPVASPVVGRLPLVPAVFGRAPDALVLGDGVFSLVPGDKFEINYYSPRQLGGVAHGDLDGDGTVDGVLVPATEDDLDVLLRTETLIPGYQLIRIDTASRVTELAIDDFDGNGIYDIAYLEQLTDHQRLMAAYGTSDRPLDPIELGSFDNTAQLTRVHFPDSIDFLSLAADLAVLQIPAAGPSITLLHGSAQRTMLAYYDPRPSDLPDQLLLRGAVVGKFAPSPSASPELNDVVTFAAEVDKPVEAWPLVGMPTGPSGTSTTSIQLTGFQTCATSTTDATCVLDATYIAVPASPTRDLVIAVDRSDTPRVALFDPANVSGGVLAAMPVPALQAKIATGTTVRSLAVADLDGDGGSDLIATFRPRRGEPGRGAVIVCELDAGVPRTCEDVLPKIAALTAETEFCADAAVGRISYRDSLAPTSSSLSLVVACRDTGSTLYRAVRTDDGFDITSLAHTNDALTAVRVGDVTGDGVDDVIAIAGESGAQALVVYPQCSSRTLESCSRGDQGGAP